MMSCDPLPTQTADRTAPDSTCLVLHLFCIMHQSCSLHQPLMCLTAPTEVHVKPPHNTICFSIQPKRGQDDRLQTSCRLMMTLQEINYEANKKQFNKFTVMSRACAAESVEVQCECAVCRPAQHRKMKRISSFFKKCCKITESGNTFQTRDT